MFWTAKDPAPAGDELTISDVASLPTKRQFKALRRFHDLWMRTEAARRNAEDPHPRIECPDCHALCKSVDLGWLYPDRCSTCDARRIENLVSAIAERIGSKATRKLLKRLGREDIPGA
jgi:hypothetical protein